MKKIIYCDGCERGQHRCGNCSRIPKIEEITVCDTCGTSLEMADIKLITPIKLNYICTDYDFCGFKCAAKFINAEIKKEKNND